MLDKKHRLAIRDLSKLQRETDSSLSSSEDDEDEGAQMINGALQRQQSSLKRHLKTEIEKAWEEVAASHNDIDKRLILLKKLRLMQKGVMTSDAKMSTTPAAVLSLVDDRERSQSHLIDLTVANNSKRIKSEESENYFYLSSKNNENEEASQKSLSSSR